MRRWAYVALSNALFAAAASAQGSRCVDCHQGNGGEPWPEHMLDWTASAHAANNVGCEKCHRGDAKSFDFGEAHQGIVASSMPTSPTHRQNVAATCGGCHPGPYAAFQESKHHEAVRGGATAPPTCTTCHGAVAAKRPSPAALAERCDGCHGEGKDTPHPERAARVRERLEEVHGLRDRLKAAQAQIRSIPDRERRNRLEESYEQALGPLTQAVHAGHRFVYDEMDEHIKDARARTAALLAELGQAR